MGHIRVVVYLPFFDRAENGVQIVSVVQFLFFDFIVRCVKSAVLYVVADGIVEQYSILKHYRNRTAQLLLRDIVYVNAVYRYLT